MCKLCANFFVALSMKTSLKLSLDKRRKRKDGSYPIILRLSHFQRTTSISTGQSVGASDWDSAKEKVRRGYKGAVSALDLNRLLELQKANALGVINKLRIKGELDYISLPQLKNRIVGKTTYDSFYDFGDSLVRQMEAANRYGSARAYKGVLGILRVFTKEVDLKFNQVNYEFLRKFERFHLSKPGNALNGLASYMRTIKAIYNKGIKEELVERDSYPFHKYKIRTIPTKKRAIKVDLIKKIMALELTKENSLFHYRNYFLLSYMFMGMSFIDMAFLRVSNLVDGRIKFQRKKTSKLYDIKITEQLKELLSFYLKEKSADDFVFPIIKRDRLDLQYKDEQWALKRYNKGLKEIADLCGIKEQLTSYVSRHSFATHALFKNIPLAAISAMLGHSKLSTTQVYLKSLPSNILDSYQEELNLL